MGIEVGYLALSEASGRLGPRRAVCETLIGEIKNRKDMD